MSNWIVNFKEDKRVWDAFVRSSPQRSIFVQSKFLDSLNANYDLVTCYEKDKIVAGVVIIYGASGEPINSTFPFTQYQGMLLSDNSSREMHSQVTYEFKVVEFFINQLAKYFKKYCLCHSWRLRDLRPFQWLNFNEPSKGQFRINLYYTAVLDLQKFENFGVYLSSVRTVRRQEFKKSSQILKFQFSDDESLLDALHAKTFERQNLERDISDSLLLRSISKQAVAGEYGKMSIALLDDVPISSVLFIYDDRASYYLFGANDPAYRNTGSGTFLIMHMIKDAFDHGLKEIDFVGANSPNRGDFKISLNAALQAYHVSTYRE